MAAGLTPVFTPAGGSKHTSAWNPLASPPCAVRMVCHHQPEAGCVSPSELLAVFALSFTLQRIFHNALRVPHTGAQCALYRSKQAFSP